MAHVQIDPALAKVLPTLTLGVLEARNVEPQERHPALAVMLDELAERLRGAYKGKVAADRPEITATRRAYRALGDDPTRYRPANEALLRRVLRHSPVTLPESGAASAQSSGIPFLHTIVDINNYVSLESGFALGCYDLQRVAGDVVVRSGAAGELYAPIGKPAVDAGNRLVLADDLGIFGSPTADSQRTMVTPATTETLFVIFGFEAAPGAVDAALNRSAALLERFAGATVAERRVVQASASA